jgi:hypothetical protein
MTFSGEKKNQSHPPAQYRLHNLSYVARGTGACARSPRASDYSLEHQGASHRQAGWEIPLWIRTKTKTKPKLDMACSQSSGTLASWEAYAWKQGKYIFAVTEHNARTNSYRNPGLPSHSGAIRRVLARGFLNLEATGLQRRTRTSADEVYGKEYQTHLSPSTGALEFAAFRDNMGLLVFVGT